MKQPVTLLLYEKLMPCGPLVTRLEDRGYRVLTIADPAVLLTKAEVEKPMLVIADLEPKQAQVCAAIAQLRSGTATAHIPIIAIAAANHVEVQEAARAAGATLVVQDNAILQHLDQFLEQALQVE
jgi:CheY-like chemotaxis protein